ncbi:MAG TPA: DUF2075 domain-containing protein [Aquificales bacterium]|nr:DUF2075 domain-containing protein [Aquificales bacterium]
MAKIFIPHDFVPEKTESFRIERLALDKVKKAFEKDKDVVIYFHPIIYAPRLGREIAPDMIWFKEGVGAAIVEVKAWDYDFLKNSTIWRGRLKHIPSGRTYTNPIVEVRRFLEGLMDLGGKPLGWVFFLPNLSYKDYELLPEEIKNYLPKERVIFQEDYSVAKEVIRQKILGSIASFYQKIPMEVIKEQLKKLKKILFPYLEIPKSDNILDEVQEQLLYSLTKGHRIIRGGPGSGKTVTLLGKALHEALKAYLSGQKRSILFLTYTNALVSKIKRDLEEIVKKRELPPEILKFIDVRTLHSYAGSILYRIAPQVKTDDPIETLLEKLGEGDIPEKFKADLLLVDESQDLRLSWFKLLHKIKKKDSIVVFGVDETQRIYEGTEWKWKDTGFDARGRTIILRKIYRSSGRIFDTAAEFLKRDSTLVRQLKELDNYWLDQVEKLNLSEGKVEVHLSENYYGETARVLRELLTRYKPGDILVLTPANWEKFNQFLEREFGDLIHYKSKELDPQKVNVTTYYSAKGLEAKATVVVGFDKLFNTKDKKADNLRRLRRLGFVALTRGQEEVHIIGAKEEGALKEVKEITEKLKKEKAKEKETAS